MKRRNVTRNALFTSIISLLLCVSMLVGTTFAWFTDSVESGRNVIAAGNLDVELYHSDHKETDAKVDGSTMLFDDVTPNLWEPGALAYENLQVKNLGTLALKYQLSLTVLDETVVNGYKLSDVIMVGTKAGGFTADSREGIIGEVTEWTKLSAFKLDNSTKPLAAGAAAEKIGIVLYWQPNSNDIDNRYNLNNGQTGTLQLSIGVNLFATQVEAESDSFGPDYDEDAWDNALLVTTAEDLKAAIAAGNEEIMLANDIALTEALEIPAGTTLALNLNGKTLSNANGYVIENYGAVTITGNGTLTGMGGIRSRGGRLTINDGNFYSSSRWQDGAYQHTLKAENSEVVINGGNFDATVKGQTNAMFNASENATITINGGNFKNVEGDLTQFDPYIFTYEKNGQVVIKNGTFYGGWRFNGETATTHIYGGNFTVGFDGHSFHANSTHIVTVSGGTFVAAANAKLTDKVKTNEVIAAGYKAVESNGKYIVVSENVDGVVTTAAGLADAIAQGGVVSVMADIDMNNAWTSVVPANGLVIEGNDHVISNLNLPLMAGKGGPTVTVKGLTIADSNVGIAANEKGLGTGAFIAFADYSGTLVFEDCHLVNSTVTGNERAAAFVGYSYAGVTIRDCSVDKCTITAVGSTAALIGHANGVTTIEKTSVTNTKVTATEDRTGSTAVAGSLIGTVANTTALNKVTSSNNTVSNTGATPYSAEFGRIVSPGNLTIDGAECVADGLTKNGVVYFVYNANGLETLNKKMADQSAGRDVVVNLLADIDFTGKTWTPVDSHADTAFEIAEINGNGHTISNLTVNGQAMFTRFAGFDDVVIKDITFDNATVNSNGNINTSILTGHSYQNVLLDNVDVKNSSITGGYKVAPLIGTVYNESTSSITATLKNCDVENVVVTATGYDFCTTGMVAFVYEGDNDTVKFENCTVSNVQLKAKPNGYESHAWIYVNDAETDDCFNEALGVTVTNCTFEAI